MAHITLAPGAFLLHGTYTELSIDIQRPLQWFRYELEAQQARDQKLYLSLLREVRDKMDKGTAKECMSTRILTSGDADMSEVEAAYAVSAPFAAGVDTVSVERNLGVTPRCG